MISRPNIKDIKSNCRYLQIDLPFRGEEDELYNYRRPFEELFEPEDNDYEFPFANYKTKRWVAVFDLKEKKILNWDKKFGAAIVDAKVRDEGIYTLLDDAQSVICTKKGYVPNGVVPPQDGCGDYLRITIEEDGSVPKIYDEFDFTEFAEDGYLPDEEQEINNSVSTNNMLIYTTADGKHSVEVNLQNETLWLSLDEIATLFDRNKSTISRHIKNIFESGELEPDSTVAKFATIQNEGNRKVERNIVCYNLDMIISIGYRVNSLRGTHFRMWATAMLKEYIIKGFVMDDDRLKRAGEGNYFDELLARVKDIRSSEKMFYRKVLEIYALSIDYDPRSSSTGKFFASVQNKMHYAAHGNTAAELIYNRADAEKDFMGLTSWRGYFPTKSDAKVAKNYLAQEEIDTLNSIVSMYLDFAELQAKAKRPMYMKDWLSKLDDFLRISERELLTHAGTISAELAKLKADIEFDKFKERTQYELSPVELHFIESFEKQQKKLKL